MYYVEIVDTSTYLNNNLTYSRTVNIDFIDCSSNALKGMLIECFATVKL